MTKFNPENRDDAAMKITEQADADQYKAEYIAFVQKSLDKSKIEEMIAEQIVIMNIGYYAGYFDHKIRSRVEKLFKCHPIFHEPTAEEGCECETAMMVGPKKVTVKYCLQGHDEHRYECKYLERVSLTTAKGWCCPGKDMVCKKIGRTIGEYCFPLRTPGWCPYRIGQEV